MTAPTDNALKSAETDAAHAVIYCRVSSTKQKTQGHGLESQESRCRDYAAQNGYTIDAVFPDDASGGGDFMARPGMVALLAYLDAQPARDYIIIFDDLKRFARDTEFHIRLRRELDARGARPECLNFTFEDSPEGEFAETIMAAQGELERKQNRRQTIQKMQARAKAGYYDFAPSVGYSFETVPGHGQLLVPDENAPVVREVLEGFADGRFQTISEASRYLAAKKLTVHGKPFRAGKQSTRDMLERALYTGYFTVESWNMHLQRGQHQPLISLATHQRIQDRLAGRSQAPNRKDLHEDFPLRNFVTCACCDEPMTAAWSKGRTKHYGYYFCKTKGCPEHRKNIRKEAIEDAFQALLRALQPLPSLLKVLRVMFRDLWDLRRGAAKQDAKRIETQVQALESKTARLMDRLVRADSETLITAYEAQIKTLEAEKLALKDAASQAFEPRKSFEESFGMACTFLANPWKLWDKGQFAHKRMVLRLAFPGTLAYCPERGFRTAKTTLPFKGLGDFQAKKSRVVGDPGIEPGMGYPGGVTVRCRTLQHVPRKRAQRLAIGARDRIRTVMCQLRMRNPRAACGKTHGGSRPEQPGRFR